MTEHTPEQIEAVRAKLTPAQRRELMWHRFTPTICQSREHPVKSALGRKGICEFHHRAAGLGDWILTPLGEALVARLKELK